MLIRNSNRSGGLGMRSLGFLALLAAFAVLFFYSAPKPNRDANQAPETESTAEVLSRKCEEDLTSLLEALSPGRLGVSSDRVTLIDRLNLWQLECVDPSASPKSGTEVEAAKQLLSGETLTRTLSSKFLPEDASHIRNSLLFREIVAHETEGKASNAERYAELFQFVCRNQILIPDEILKELPLTDYESLVFGMGSPAHRAWTFSELLRQMRTDAVIITPRGEGLQDNWLVGVIDPRDGVFLFDPRIGMPIPPLGVKAEGGSAPLAATLSQVLESDEHFRLLDIPDSPYPLKSADLKEISVAIIGTSSSWAPRMAQLQFLLPAKYTTELYDGLVESELRSPGLKQRALDAGTTSGWKVEDITVWPYPEQQLMAFEATRGQGTAGSALENLLKIFQGPYMPHQANKDGPITLVPVDKSLHFVRVEQLRGDQVAAMKDYLPIRSTAKMAPSRGNELAAEYAALWTGVAQYETRKFHPAFNTLGRFFSGQATSTGMARAGIEWAAECLVAEKEYAAAAKLLSQAPQGLSPRRDKLLIRQWEAIAGVKPEDKPKETPASTKPNDTSPAGEMPAKPQEPAKPEDKPAAGEMPAKPPVAADDKKPAEEKKPESAKGGPDMPLRPPVPEKPETVPAEAVEAPAAIPEK